MKPVHVRTRLREKPGNVLARLTFLVLHAVSLSVRVGRLAVVDVVAVQVRELGEELEDGLPVVGQVGHLAVKQVQTLQLRQLFLAGRRQAGLHA